MEIFEAIQNRHSVRSYVDKAIPAETLAELEKEIALCNNEGGLHIQLAANEPEAFGGLMAHYGKIRGVQNYIALIGKKAPDLDERLGYYGERIALKVQRLGLNTCWVALTYSKGKSRCDVDKGEKLVCVLALGYGETNGVAHRSRDMKECCNVSGEMPDWFRKGMEFAMLAPTAMNQQRFMFTLSGDKVEARSTGGFYSKVDLGIVKYHFEIGSGRKI
ncbi:MAG: nitroreductase family protein [Clostridia bacterium]